MSYSPLDVAAVSVDQVRALRHASRFDITFTVLGCHSELLAHGIRHAKLAEPFDVVPMQSCMCVDAFESDAKAHCILCQQICNLVIRACTYINSVKLCVWVQVTVWCACESHPKVSIGKVMPMSSQLKTVGDINPCCS